jgi:hypothetical protein
MLVAQIERKFCKAWIDFCITYVGKDITRVKTIHPKRLLPFHPVLVPSNLSLQPQFISLLCPCWYHCHNFPRYFPSDQLSEYLLLPFFALGVIASTHNVNTSLKMTAFCDITPCSLVEVYWRFRNACCLYHQGKNFFVCSCIYSLRSLTLLGAMFP